MMGSPLAAVVEPELAPEVLESEPQAPSTSKAAAATSAAHRYVSCS